MVAEVSLSELIEGLQQNLRESSPEDIHAVDQMNARIQQVFAQHLGLRMARPDMVACSIGWLQVFASFVRGAEEAYGIDLEGLWEALAKAHMAVAQMVPKEAFRAP